MKEKKQMHLKIFHDYIHFIKLYIKKASTIQKKTTRIFS